MDKKQYFRKIINVMYNNNLNDHGELIYHSIISLKLYLGTENIHLRLSSFKN